MPKDKLTLRHLQPHKKQPHEPKLSSPVCYANSDEVREEFKEHLPVTEMEGLQIAKGVRSLKVNATSKSHVVKTQVLKISAIALILFALITIFMNGSVIFDLFGIREREGNYVLFIVITNFLCGFLYLLAGYGMFFSRIWTTRILLFSTSILVMSFIGLGWHISTGGIYEQQTVRAMLFRISLTAAFTGLSWRLVLRKN